VSGVQKSKKLKANPIFCPATLMDRKTLHCSPMYLMIDMRYILQPVLKKWKRRSVRFCFL